MSSDTSIGTVSPKRLKRLKELTGHDFKDVVRLDRALTHSSARHRTGKDYERLEFLGDRVLGLCVADMLFSRFPNAKEGELSVRLNALVNADTLADVADDLDLHEFIRIGADVRDLQSDRQKNTRADVVESLIAAIYLEGGLEAARQFIVRYWQPRAGEIFAARRDAKTELQEWSHKMHNTVPTYTEVAREGPDHEPVFKIEVSIGKMKSEIAAGRSKRLAEQAAAEKILRRENVWKDQESGDA